MSKKGTSKKKQFVLFGACSLLAMVLCMVTLVVTVKNIDGDDSGAVSTMVNAESKTKLTDEKLIDYLYNLTNEAIGNDFIKVNSFTDVSVDDGNIVVLDKDGNASDRDKNIFAYAKNYFIPLVDGLYGDDVTGVFGENTGEKPLLELEPSDNLKGSFTVGAVDDTGKNLLNEDGTIVDGDFYYIDLELDGKYVVNEAEKSTFGVKDLADGIDAINDKIASECKISSVEVTPDKFYIKAKVNRITDEIEYVEIQRNYNVKGDFNFIERLSVFGEKEVQFTYCVTQRYEYFYAGIDLLEDEVTVNEKGEVALTVSAQLEDYSDYTVRFISSDEKVATVDEMGYVTGVKCSDTPVIITVELEYLGKIFTDQCTVYVNDGENTEEVAK
ncbi:MAG: Ig-like domain-containing protein [Clostridia bacterium]|nr:Ig-like domain-containing protein [Clostridia bacterium]